MTSLLANYFVLQKKLETHIVIYGIHKEIEFKLHPRIQIHHVSSSAKHRPRPIVALQRMRFIRRTVHNLKPDALLSFGELWNNFVLISCLGLKIPVFISDRGHPGKSLGILHNFLRRILYPRASGIIAQTSIAKAQYEKIFKNLNIKVIGNPIDVSNSKTSHNERENIILSVGRLIHSKHFDRLIEVFLDLDLDGWKLQIIGDDAQKQNNSKKLEALIGKRNANDRIQLLGKKTDLKPYYENSKIFAFTSSSEGFPNAIGEALAGGLPVVAFDAVPGVKDMITDGYNGLLVPLFNYQIFSEKLGMLANDRKLRENLQKNTKRSIKKYSLERIGENFLDYIFGEG